METAGPAFIKLGQWLTTRPDYFPPQLCDVFKKLQDNVHPHPFSQTRRSIEEAFSVPFHELFEEFELTPLGVGCVAQVYKATLRPPYRPKENPSGKVAVKVLHQRAVSSIDRDLRLMTFVANVVNTLVPPLRWMGAKTVANNFAEFMVTQLDLTHEAANMTKFRENFKARPRVKFATPYYPLVSQNVLVESFEEGVSVAKFMEVKDGPWNHEIANLGLSSFLRMVLRHNFVHADLHPGNIFVQVGDKQAGLPLNLVFLDCGLVSQLNDVDLENFVALFMAVKDGNGQKAAELMVERTTGDKSQMVDVPGFVKEMSELVRKNHNFKPGEVYIGNVLSSVLSLVHKHRVPLETNTSNLIMGIIVVEGIGRQLNPKINIFEFVADALKPDPGEEPISRLPIDELDTWTNRLALFAYNTYHKVVMTVKGDAEQ